MNMSKLDDIKAKLSDIDNIDELPDFIKAVIDNEIVSSIINTDEELDGIALIAIASRRFVDQYSIWSFYQSILNQSCNKAEAAFIIAEACSYVKKKSGYVLFNIVRLVYFSVSDILLNNFEGHSDLRISCARVLTEIEQLDDAALFLESLLFILNDGDELARELPYINDNGPFFRELAENRLNIRLREAARLLISKVSVQ